MIRYLLIFTLFISSFEIQAQQNEWFKELDREIENEWFYVQQKEQGLDSLKHLVIENNTKGKEWEQYQLFRKIADEYTVYVFDSAMWYYRKAIEMAYQIDHKGAIAETLSEYGHLLVSVGYYKEAIDTLNRIEIADLQDAEIQNYYSYKVRAYYDLADYIRDDFYSPEYRKMADDIVDSVLLYQQKGAIKPVMTKALRFLVNWQPDSAKYYYQLAFKKYNPNLHQQAMLHSSLGYIQMETGDSINGMLHLVQSAIADIKSVTKEATSLRTLSRYLYEHGDIQRAYKYILIAKKDTEFFGSKQRKLEVSDIFPSIEGAKLLLEEKQKEKAIRYAWIVSLLILVVISFLLLVYRQLFNLRKIWVSISKSNKELKLLNGQLQEANKIKEKYIGHFFNTSSRYIGKLEHLSKALNKLLVSNNPQKLKSVLKEINPKKERDQLFHNFDEVFLSLFPDFIKEVNALNKPGVEYVLKPGQLLNTELRILALIRLGIDDNETISKVLDVSINTIYTYKTKAKNKSELTTEMFFKKLNLIKANSNN